MNASAPLLKPYRFARIAFWARTMLVWVALILCSPDAYAGRRRIRQRYHSLSLGRMASLAHALILIRAVEITKIAQRARPTRNAAPPGFRRRIDRAARMRATIGARLRKALKHRDASERIRLLLAALADIDGFARRYLAPRALRRLTKLFAIVMSAPPADAVASLTSRAPCAADSS